MEEVDNPTVPEMVKELYIVILGVKGTAEEGMAGKVNKIERHLVALNAAVIKNTAWRKAHTWLIGICFTAVITVSSILIVVIT